MFRDSILELVNEVLSSKLSLFLIALDITADNKIKVVIDGEKNISLSDCIAVSRAIENRLDREEQDFALEVTSAGISSPLVDFRQYQKNIGKLLRVKTKEDSIFEGKLAGVDLQSILLKWKTRVPKPIGKGKITVEKSEKINFTEIIEAKVVIHF